MFIERDLSPARVLAMLRCCYLILVLLLIQCCALWADEDFPEPRNTQPKGDYPISAEEALEKFTVPEGFKVQLFAKEPDVQQPIGMAFDHRGRVYVTECYTYTGNPGWLGDQRDRIIILEDKDQDGAAEKRTVFWQQGNRMSSALPGLGGVYILNNGTLAFIPDANQDDVPDREPQILLDGFNKEEITHNIVSGLMWGPDGWLYGRHGIQATSYVGKPGMATSERTLINCGIWRFHPVKHVFEVVCHGTTNPWGLDYNSVGEFFMTNNVIGHLWHVIPGAHFKRMYGADFNPYVYELIDQTADHYHWNNAKTWQDSRANTDEVSALGGGHSHCGGMIYNSATWPETYRDCMFMSNTHGRRLNIDRLVRQASGYTGKHEPDFFLANQPHYRGTNILQGPDGNILVSDWVDNGECHDRDGVHRTSGRVYKIVYGKPEFLQGELDLTLLTSAELARLTLHPNDWWQRTARLLLQERAIKKENMQEAEQELLAIYKTHPDTPSRLRALWSLHALGSLDLEWYIAELNQEDEYISGWMLKSLGNLLALVHPEESEQHAALEKKIIKALIEFTEKKRSPYLRLQVASLLQRLHAPRKWAIMHNISHEEEDCDDLRLVLMYWYAIEGDTVHHVEPALEFAGKTVHSKLRQFIARRLTSEFQTHPEVVLKLMETIKGTTDTSILKDYLLGFKQGLAGWRKLAAPADWQGFSEYIQKLNSAELNKLLLEISLIFGDGQAIDELILIARDKNAPLADRERAALALIEDRSAKLLPTFKEMLNDRGMETFAIRGLSEYDDPLVSKTLINKYPRLSTELKREVIKALTSRSSYAKSLLSEDARKQIPLADISAFDARQIINLSNAESTAKLKEVWGDIRESSTEMAQKYEQYKAQLQPDKLKQADLVQGRAQFQKLCINCHKLLGEGGTVGPDLTGANRDNLDYLLENILEPSKIIGKQYRISIVQREDGKTFTGILLSDVNNKLTLQTEKETLVLDREEILEVKASELSLMPDGVLDKLSADEVRDLFGYLMKK